MSNHTPKNWCRWCGDTLPEGGRVLCSLPCAEAALADAELRGDEPMRKLCVRSIRRRLGIRSPRPRSRLRRAQRRFGARAEA